MLLRAGMIQYFPGDSMAKTDIPSAGGRNDGRFRADHRYYCKIGLIRPAYTNGRDGGIATLPRSSCTISTAYPLPDQGRAFLKDIQQIIAGNDIDLLTLRLAEEKRPAAPAHPGGRKSCCYYRLVPGIISGKARLHGRNHHIPGAPLSGPQYRDGAGGQEQCFEDFYAAYGQVRNRPEYSTVHFTVILLPGSGDPGAI